MTEDIVHEKSCTKCNVTKPLTDYHLRSTAQNKHHCICKACFSVIKSELSAEQRERKNIRQREWYRTPAGQAAVQRRPKTPRRRPARQIKAERLRRLYKMTLEDYEQMLYTQGGVCAICSRQPNGTPLAVDHCHATGKIRGLLCMICNTALGRFHDSPELFERAKQYLLSNI